MLKWVIIAKHRPALDDLFRAGIIGSRYIISMAMRDRIAVLEKTGHPAPQRRVAEEFGVCRQTVYKRLRELNEEV